METVRRTPESFLADDFPYPADLPCEAKACYRCKDRYTNEFKCDPFPVNCGLTYDLQLLQDDRQGKFNTIDPDEADLLRILLDPVAWAEIELGWTARWYQAKMLRCSAQMKIARIGRRAGKCIDANQELVLSDGRRVTARQLYQMYQEGFRGEIEGIDQNYRNVFRPFTIFPNGKKHRLKITTKLGREVVISDNHPFYKYTGWEEAGDLVIGDRVAMLGALHTHGTEELPEAEVKLLAYLASDGGCTGSSIKFTNQNDRILEELRDLLPKYDVVLTHEANYDYRFKQLMQKHKIDCLAKHKRVPEAIFRAPNHQVALFLNRFFACGGWAYSSGSPKRRARIGISLASKQLIDDVAHLLARFGIYANISPKRAACNGKTFDAWTLSIQRHSDIVTFANQIGIFSKESALAACLKIAQDDAGVASNRLETIPQEVWNDILEEKDRRGFTGRQVTGGGIYAPHRSKVATCARNLGMKELEKIATSELLFDTIVSIEDVGYGETFDLTVEDTHNFLVGGFLTHNTAAMAVDILWKAVTKGGTNRPGAYNILIVCPYESHVLRIFDEITNLIDQSETLQYEVKRSVITPHHLIELNNGSTIRGFTAGVRTGSKSVKVRGQDADTIYIDEADYLSDEDLEAILAILASHRHCTLWLSSTPTGLRQKFYRFCLTAGTLINQPGQATTAVEDIKVGDQIIAIDGKPDTVSELFEHQYKGSLYSPVTWHNTMWPEFTEGHELMTSNGWKDVDEIVPGDYLAIPIEKVNPPGLDRPALEFNEHALRRLAVASGTKLQDVEDMTSQNVYHLRRKLAASGPAGMVDAGFREKWQSACRIIDDLPRTQDFYEILGLYLAKGSTLRNRDYVAGVQFTFHKDEVDLHQKVVDFFSAHSNGKIVEQDRLGYVSQGYRILIYDSAWGIALKHLCGEYAEGKEVHPALLDGSDLETHLFGGWFAGNAGTTISRTLAYQMFQLLLRHDRMANLYHSLAFDNHQESWTVRPRTSHRQTGYIEDGTYWVEVKSVESRSFEGTVYNFETKRTHTYTAELLGVHNCTKKEIGFKEYHYPSQVNPEFTPEAEALFREVYSDAAYDHEILAEFGEAEMGVFTQKHIDACVERLAYSYKDCNPPRAGMQVRDLPPTIMGVDWNETAGIHIVIVVYDSEVDAFKMVHKSVVHSKKATQIAGLQKIIDLNKYWRPDYIYVDKGAGTTNIELLHRYGAENPTTKLHKIVKGVGFGEKIEVKDPFVKGKVEKKPVKPLVVNIACRRVEDHMCLFPVEEDFEKEMDDAGAVRKTLLGQMRNFIIERYNQSGMPIYSQGDEHTLIAWMLCIFGFIVEFTDTLMMGKSRLIDVRIAGNFGEKGGRMFQEAKQRAAKEKRKRLVVPPRWHSVGGVFGLFASSSGYHPRNYASDKAKVQQRLTKSASRGRAQLPGRHIGRRTMGGPGKRTTF